LPRSVQSSKRSHGGTNGSLRSPLVSGGQERTILTEPAEPRRHPSIAVVALSSSWQELPMRGRLEVSGFPDPDRRRAIKRLGRKVASSPRDSTAREHSLPWARCSIPANLRRVKDSPAPAPIRTAAAVACSRDVSAGSAPPVHRPVIAHQLASGRPGAGGAGGPLSVTAPAITVSNAGVSKVNAIASNAVSAAP